MVLVPQAPSPSLSGAAVSGSPSGCSSRLRPGARPHSAPSPASLTRPCHAEPRLSHQRPAHAQRGSPRGPGVCGALPPADPTAHLRLPPRPPRFSLGVLLRGPVAFHSVPAPSPRRLWKEKALRGPSTFPALAGHRERGTRCAAGGGAGLAEPRCCRPARGGHPQSPLTPPARRLSAGSGAAAGRRRARRRRRQETHSSQGRARSRTGFCRHRHATQARPPADRLSRAETRACCSGLLTLGAPGAGGGT